MTRYMRNPYIRAKMVEALVAFMPAEVRRSSLELTHYWCSSILVKIITATKLVTITHTLPKLFTKFETKYTNICTVLRQKHFRLFFFWGLLEC